MCIVTLESGGRLARSPQGDWAWTIGPVPPLAPANAAAAVVNDILTLSLQVGSDASFTIDSGRLRC